ncbi:ankyrin repeat-containing domain protein [Aspergillus karnatakaensis]|uniref:ankyrin repeat domain-containing protein n=1 Tax=Aspergillus karnatakaensis TaxID=1810916 RepID=UPI003CCCBC92
MTLQDLPTELLLLITDLLEPNEINALVLTCRQLHAIFNSILYRHAVKSRPDRLAAWIGQKGQLRTLQEFVKAGGNATTDAHTSPLFRAAAHGQDSILRALIKMGIDVDLQSSKSKHVSALFMAVREDHLSTVRLLLEAGAAIDACGEDDETVLMSAAAFGRDEIFMLLLNSGADLAAEHYSGRPLLNYALEGGCGIPIVELLLENTPKERIDQMGESSYSALGHAALMGDIPAARLLLAAGASLDAGGRDDTPLRVAIENGEEEMVRFLLDAGADANETPAQYAPLPLASDLGLDRVLKLLLERGADPTYVLPWLDKPLDIAVMHNHYRCAKLLLDAGALGAYRTDDLDDMRYSLVMLDDDMAIPIAQKMAISGAYYNRDALLWAARNGNRRIVELALAHGADLEREEESDSPLMVAAMNGHAEFAKLFLKHGANAYFTAAYGQTALAVAAQRGWVDVVRELVHSQPVDLLDLVDHRKRTPLFHATVMGHIAVAAILLAHGSAAIDTSTSASRTPRSVVEELTRRRADLDAATQDTVKAFAELFDDPATAKSTESIIEKTKPTLCKPGEMRGISHYDLWALPEGASQCLYCRIAIPAYGVRFYPVHSNDVYCPECRGATRGNFHREPKVPIGPLVD